MYILHQADFNLQILLDVGIFLNSLINSNFPLVSAEVKESTCF